MWIKDEFRKYIECCQQLTYDNISITSLDEIIYVVGHGECRETNLPISRELTRLLLHFCMENNPNYYIIENYKHIIPIWDNSKDRDFENECISRVVMPLFYREKLCGSIVFSSYSKNKIFSYLDVEEMKVIKRMVEKFIIKVTSDIIV